MLFFLYTSYYEAIFMRMYPHPSALPTHMLNSQSKFSFFVYMWCCFPLRIPPMSTKKPECLRYSALTLQPVVVKASRAYAFIVRNSRRDDENQAFLALTWRSINKPGASDSQDDIYKWHELLMAILMMS